MRNLTKRTRQVSFVLGITVFLGLLCVVVIQKTSPSAVSVLSYWVWAYEDLNYVQPQSELILYQGTVTREWQFEHRGLYPYELSHSGTIKILFRLDVLGDQRDIARQYLSIKDDWSRHGVNINGLQIDHDSPSSKLNEYAIWITELKRELPHEEITVTSLVSYIGDAPEEFHYLASVADGVAVQLYQGYHPHDHIGAVVTYLNTNKIDHYIGITLSPEFTNPETLCRDFCHGIVVFLNKQGEVT